jgi:hypothetical protein
MHDRPSLRLPGAALLLLALAGCAPPSPPPDPSLLSGTPARVRGCHLAAIPEELPPAAALVDTAALDAGIADLRDDTPVGPGYVLLSLGYAPDGVNVVRTVIEHTLRPGVADSLQKLVFAHRRALPARETEWGVRLRIDLDGPPRYRVGRRQLCLPRVRALGFDDDGIQNRYGSPGAGHHTVWVRVRLDALGRVTAAQVERGFIGRGPQEILLLNYVRTLSFEPAREDGRPVPSEISVPVRMGRW